MIRTDRSGDFLTVNQYRAAAEKQVITAAATITNGMLNTGLSTK